MTISDTGNVGIGTTSPTRKLHVVGGSTYAALLDSDQDYTLGLARSGTEEWWLKTYTDGRFAIHENGVGDKVTIKAGGNVGIGTTSPFSKLHIDSNTPSAYTNGFRDGELRIANDNSSNIANQTSNIVLSATGWAGSTTGVAQLSVIQDGSNVSNGTFTIKVRDNGTHYEAFRIKHNGNVGIGTTSPSQKLHVSSASAVFQLTDTNKTANNSIWIQALSQTSWGIGTANNASSGTKITIADSGNVGIGTTSPSAKLDIYGDSNSGDNMIELINSKYDSTNTTGETGILFGWNNHVAARITAFKEGTVNRTGFKIVGEAGFNVPTTIATFRSTGRVGIGTTDPDHTLMLEKDVNGEWEALRLFNYHSDGSTVGSVAINMDVRASNGQIARASIKSRESTADSPYSELGFFTSNTTSTAPSERMTIDKDGNVGIGTTSPGAKLEVAGGNGAIAGNGLVYFNNSDDAFSMVLNNAGTSSQNDRGVFDARVGGSSVFRINNSGNVGIGTTSPDTKLEVAGDLKVSLGAIIGNVNTSSSTTNYESILRIKGKNNYNGDGTTWYGDYGQIILHSNSNYTSSARRFMITNALDNYKFAIVRSVDADTDPSVNATALGVNSGTADFVIDNAGNVGIGTTNPSDKLTVEGNISIGSSYKLYNGAASDSAGITFPGVFTRIDGFNGITFNSSTTNVGSQTERMRITNSGNVGIGTTSPAQLLHISNTSGDFGAEAVLRGSTSTGTPKSEVAFKRGTSGDGAKMVLRTSDSSGTIQDVMTLDTSGNVGIGTSFPEAKLFIQYSDATTNTVLRTKLDAAYSMGISNDWVSTYVSKLRLGRVGSSTATSNMEFVYDIQGTEYGSIKRNYTASSLKFERGTTVDMIINGSGNVGIGTTGPTEKLTIFGTAASPSTSGIGANGNFAIESSNGNSLYFGSYAASPYGCWLQASNYIDQSLKYPIILNPNGGNVGIGTTSPNRKLTVNAPGAANGTQNITAQFSNATVGATSSAIYIGAYTGTDWLIGKNIYGTAGHTNFEIGNQSTGSSPVVSINNNNNVGIGTTSPASKLDVDGDIALKGTAVFNFVSPALTIGDIAGTDSVNSLKLTTADDSTTVYLDDGGNVGIGTTSPSGALHVKSSTAATTGMVRFQNNMDNNYETLRIESEGNFDAHIGFLANGTSNYWWGMGIDYSDAGK